MSEFLLDRAFAGEDGKRSAVEAARFEREDGLVERIGVVEGRNHFFDRV
jgi:hypothetical protein